jgi:uncharacterized membrane protein
VIARPYAIVCTLLLLGMFAVAAGITLHLQAIGARQVFFDTVMLFFVPATTLAFALMWLLVAAMAPLAGNMRRSPSASGAMALVYLSVAALGFADIVGIVLGQSWLGPKMIYAGWGIALIVIGNLAGKLRLNSVFGFRNPWALADEEVWGKTQRFGGWTSVIWGFLLLNASMMFQTPTVLWIAFALTLVFSTMILLASQHFARQKHKARNEAWERLAS